MTRTLRYTPESAEVRHLVSADARLAGLIERIGTIEQPLEDDGYASLAGAIIAQQLSDAAATTIQGRVERSLGGLSPDRVLAASDETLRGAGLSRSKSAFLRDLAARVADGSLDLERVAALPDHEVITELMRVKGIGRWTAEMFLIFSLGRPDVLALDDGALRATVGWLYHVPGEVSREKVAGIGAVWAPYRTAASLYLWRALPLRRAEARTSRG